VRALTVELPTPAGWVRPVHDVSFALAAGETLGLVGESGCGKTMLALAVMGLLPPGARLLGEAWFSTRDVAPPFRAADSPAPERGVTADRVNLAALPQNELRHVRGREMAMIFQEPMTALNPVLRIGTQVEEVVRLHHAGLGDVEGQVLEALERAAVPEPALRARQYPHQLSGGLRQRAMMAMALAGRPRLLIADEPTTALDVTVQKQILELLVRLREELGLALLFITHDLGVVALVAERLAVMYAGRIVEEGPTAAVLRAPRHPYTAGLLKAAPRLARSRLEPIAGAVPRLEALPPGCAFEPRCPLRRAECSAAVPALRTVPESPGHTARCILV
jgi:oligopeptide/dipeptide ABC transporter ATP-binding protein